MGEDGPGTLPRGPTNLAEVFGGDSVVVPAGQLVHKSQHLVLGPDEFRLDGAAWSTQEETGSRAVSHPAASQACVPLHGRSPRPSLLTHWTLSWGLALRRPLCTCAGSSRECSQMELAPLLASVCTICGQEAPE